MLNFPCRTHTETSQLLWPSIFNALNSWFKFKEISYSWRENIKYKFAFH